MPPLETDRAGLGDDQPNSPLRPFLQKGGNPIVGRSVLIGEIIIQSGHDNPVLKVQLALDKGREKSFKPGHQPSSPAAILSRRIFLK
jgi:hypothetical protein